MFQTRNYANLMQSLPQIAVAIMLSLGSPDLSGQTQGSTPVLFTNAHIIVGDGSRLENADVLIRDGEIISVGEVPASRQAQARIVDLAGKTLMPALIDAHAHLGYQSREGWGADQYHRENLISNLNQYAYYGFAAVFSAGSDPDDLALELQAAQVAGEIGGAKFLFAAGMAPPGQGPNDQFLVHTNQLEQQLGMTVLRGLGSAEQARQNVRDVAAKGIEFIKIWVDDRGGSQTKLEPEIYRAVIAEAQRHDVKVFAHQQFASDMPGLLNAGVDGFLHGRLGNEFTRSIAETVAGRDVFIVPNLGLGELRRQAIGRDPFLAPLISIETVQRLGDNDQRTNRVVHDPLREQALQASFTRLLEAGADLVLGTDAGAVPDHPFGYTGHRELEIFVRLGVSPMAALVAATGNAARHLRISDMGLIEPGYRANLLILNGNPLENIRNTQNIHEVYLDGSAVDREALLGSQYRNI